MDSVPQIEAIYELAPQQEGMLLESLRQGGDLFIEQEIHALPGALDLDVFEKTLAYLIARHTMLRTAFAWKNRARPLQVVFGGVAVPVRVEDWRGRPTYQVAGMLEQYLETDRAAGFDLGSVPLLRVSLLRVSEQAYQMVWTQHHILFDGWSRAILLREFSAAYLAFVQGSVPAQGTAPLYARYVEWLKGRDTVASEAFWRDALTGFKQPTPLGRPSLLSAPPARERFQEVDLALSPVEAERLCAAARAQRTTLAAVVHGAWGIVLSRYSGQDDVVFGSTVSNRPAGLPGAEEMVGLFVNSVPLRLRIHKQMLAWDWLRALQSHLLALREHESCSAGQIHAWSEVPGSVPLYESLLVFENYPVSKTHGLAAPSDRGRFIGARTPHALTLLASGQQGVELRAIFDTRRLARVDTARTLYHLCAAMRLLVAHPECRVDDLQRGVADCLIPRVHPAPQAAAARVTRVAPATALEVKLLALAGEVLGRNDIGMSDCFFDLDGHSLLAAQLLARIERAFRVELTMLALFESADLRDLAGRIEKAVLDKVAGLSDDDARALIEAIA